MLIGGLVVVRGVESDVNPLVTDIMKAKYYARSDFLNATLGENPSYTWRSILASLGVIIQGCRRKIGNGKDTKIWRSDHGCLIG